MGVTYQIGIFPEILLRICNYMAESLPYTHSPCRNGETATDHFQNGEGS